MRSMMLAVLAIGMAGCMTPMSCGMGHGGHDQGDHEGHGAAETRTSATEPAGTAPAATETWECPMGHFRATHAGKCPTCGMDLKRK